jgi:hypothetical protein
VSPASCAQTPPLQSLSTRQGTHEAPDPLPLLDEPEPPLLAPCPLTLPVPPSPKAASFVVALPEQASTAVSDASPPSRRTRGMYDMFGLRA